MLFRCLILVRCLIVTVLVAQSTLQDCPSLPAFLPQLLLSEVTIFSFPALTLNCVVFPRQQTIQSRDVRVICYLSRWTATPNCPIIDFGKH